MSLLNIKSKKVLICILDPNYTDENKTRLNMNVSNYYDPIQKLIITNIKILNAIIP